MPQLILLSRFDCSEEAAGKRGANSDAAGEDVNQYVARCVLTQYSATEPQRKSLKAHEDNAMLRFAIDFAELHLEAFELDAPADASREPHVEDLSLIHI